MSRILAVVGAIAAIFGAVLLYARAELFDPASLGDHAGAALADPDVRLAISPTVAQAIADVSPENAPTNEQVAQALENPRVVAAFEAASGAAARQLFGRDGGDVELELADVTAAAIAVSAGASADSLGISASDFESARLDLISGKAVLDALDAAERASWIGLILLPLGVLGLLLSILLAPDRLRGLSGAATAFAVVAVLLLALYYVGREITLAQFDDQLTRDAVSDAWAALLGDLRTGTIVAAGAAALTAAAAGLAASRRGPAY